MLIGKRTGGGVFRERLENRQIPVGSLGLMQASLDHSQLVVSRGGRGAHADIFSEQFRGLRELLAFDAQVRESQQSFGVLRIRTQGLLEKTLRRRVIPLVLLDVTEVVQARRV